VSHLTVMPDNADALHLLDEWFTALVDPGFDLNRAESLLRPFEERQDLLLDLQSAADPPAQWWPVVTDRRDYLTARAYWTREWYKSIPFLPSSRSEHPTSISCLPRAPSFLGYS